jgi:hypothetical protein
VFALRPSIHNIFTCIVKGKKMWPIPLPLAPFGYSIYLPDSSKISSTSLISNILRVRLAWAIANHAKGSIDTIA